MANNYEQTRRVSGAASGFPFKSTLNLASLVSYWEHNLKSEHSFWSAHSASLLERIEASPELKQPIEDMATLEKHKDLLGFLMSAIFPAAQLDIEVSAAIVPFRFESFFVTPAFEQVMPSGQFNDKMVVELKDHQMYAGKIMAACLLILNKHYNAEIKHDKPLHYFINDKVTGLEKIYKVDIDDRFTDVVAKGNPKPIHKDEIRFLTENMFDVDLWLQFIRTKDFEFEGFMIFKLIDVTEQAMLSAIKYDLLQKDAVINKTIFTGIEQKMRSIFDLPELRLGLAAFDGKSNVISNHHSGIWNSVILNQDIGCECCEGSIYERVFLERKPIIVEDLENYQGRSRIEDKLLEQGIRNVAIAPLIVDNDIIG